MNNSVLSYFEKQQGLSNNLTYDFALTKLCVKKEDCWKGITPSDYTSDFNPEPPIFASKFSTRRNYEHILAIANEDGMIALQDTRKRNELPDEQTFKGQQCHYNAVFDLEWVPGEDKFVSASGDHTARLWSIRESEFYSTRVFSGHIRSVKTVAFRKNDTSVFATGGRDGAILIWDIRTASGFGNNQVENCIFSGHLGDSKSSAIKKRTRPTPKLASSIVASSITGLAFQDDSTLVSCGAGDGKIKMWDLRRNYVCYKRGPLPKQCLQYAGSSTYKAFTNLLIDSSGMRLYASCMDNVIYCYNLSSYSSVPMQKYIGLCNSTFYIKSCLSPDDNYLLSGSSDDKAYLWNVKNSQPLLTLNGHNVEVTCVAWSKGYDMPIVTCSDDARHKIWRVGPKQVEVNEQSNYGGYAEPCVHYRNQLLKNRLTALDHTPRTLRNLVEQNERTPSTVEKLPTKRTFSEMSAASMAAELDEEWGSEHKQKRPHYESRARRLFSPSTSNHPSNSRTVYHTLQLPSYCRNGEISVLNRIIEETFDDCQPPEATKPKELDRENDTSSRNQNDDDDVSSCNVASTLDASQQNLVDNPDNVEKPENRQSSSVREILVTPTANLPNYVLDGEAPHLRNFSPKKEPVEKVDWLTKFRKQKMLTSRPPPNTNEKLKPFNSTDAECTSGGEEDFLSSPRLQPNSRMSPFSSRGSIYRRRNSRSHSESPQHQKVNGTPARSTDASSILRFFSILSPTHSRRHHHQVPITKASASNSQ